MAKAVNKISSQAKVARAVRVSKVVAARRSPDSNSSSRAKAGSKVAVKADSQTSNFLCVRWTENPGPMPGFFLFNFSTQAALLGDACR